MLTNPRPTSRLTRRSTQGLALAALLMLSPSVLFGQEGVAYTDSLGREVSLPAPATRLAVPQTAPVGMILAITQNPSYLVGIPTASRTNYSANIMGRIYPDILEVPVGFTVDSAGLTVNVEELAALEPDLIMQRDAPEDAFQPMLNAGLTVALYGIGSEATTQHFISMVSTLVGMEERGEAMNAARNALYEEIEAVGATIPEAERVRTLYVISADGNAVEIVADYSNVSEALRMVGVAGLTLPTTGTSATTSLTVSAEEIATWNPDVILVGLARSKDAIVDNPILSATNAAINDQIYVLPSGSGPWSSWNPETPLLWVMLAELLYPDHYDYDFRQEVRDWFQHLYAYDIAEEEIDEIIYADLNAGTAGFERLLAD